MGRPSLPVWGFSEIKDTEHSRLHTTELSFPRSYEPQPDVVDLALFLRSALLGKQEARLDALLDGVLVAGELARRPRRQHVQNWPHVLFRHHLLAQRNLEVVLHELPKDDDTLRRTRHETSVVQLPRARPHEALSSLL